MRVISVDIETTSVWANTAHMLSLGYAIWEDGELTIGEEYFMYDKLIPQSSIDVHGITNRILAEKSQGLYFEDKVDELARVFWDEDAIAIGFNCKAFDFRIINTALLEIGRMPCKYKMVVDLLSVARKRWKPSPWDPDKPANLKLDTVYNQCCKEIGGGRIIERWFDSAFPGGEHRHHTAAWDAFMTLHIARCLTPDLFESSEA